MNLKFTANYISVTEKSVLFLRNRFPYKEIISTEILKVELTKGTDLKRPMLAIAFGVCLILLGGYLIINFSNWNPDELRGKQGAKALGYFLILEFFLVALGGYAIFSAAPIHPVARFILISGESESLSIRDIIKEKRLADFLVILKNVIGTSKVLVSRSLEQ